MSFPLMNKRSRQGVVIPDLAGGINLRDSVHSVADNQLTDAVNVWYKDGVLKTRPGCDKSDVVLNIPVFPLDNINLVKPKPEKIYINYNGLRYQLYSCFLKRVYQTGVENSEEEVEYIDVIQRRLAFMWVSSEDRMEIDPITPDSDVEYFTFQHKDKVYCFTSECKIYMYTINEEDFTQEWAELTEEDIYAPLVMTNVLSNTQDSSETDLSDAVTGDMVEGFNLLTRRYKALYSTVNKGLLSNTQTTHKMIYQLPFVCANCEGITFKVTITRNYEGSIYSTTHTATFANMLYGVESDQQSDGLRMKICPKKIIFYKGTTNDIATVSEADYVLNNMEVIAFADVDTNSMTAEQIVAKNKEKVFGMTRCEWFGGASVGINGGTRLFLGGNTNADESGLVIWSGLNEPLYFSENCYAYVGNPTQPVTAFGKQSDMLVIFKENEVYFTRYTQNDSITADDLIDQSVVDYTASSVYFPLTQINAHIGCDCPDTVQLCRNRLVWTNTDGKVYTLVTNNQYSERNIYEIGEMIENRLSDEKNLKTAFSADWKGYYVLLSGDHVYLMDYNSNGFQYAYSYQKNEDANVRIPWYYWELDFIRSFNSGAVLLSGLDDLVIANCYTVFGNLHFSMYRFDSTSENDDGSPIRTELQTKLFDFGAGGYRKNVDQVTLMLGNNGGAPITVGFVTDCGTEYDEIMLDGDETQPYTAGYIRALTLSPCIRSVLRFGVKLSCDGPLAVDGMTLNYRILGGAR